MQLPFRARYPAGTLFAAGLVLLVTFGCRSKADEPKPAPLPTVRTLAVKLGKEEPISLRGTVQANSRLRLGFKQSGVIASVLVKEGDDVHKGQAVAQLDPTDALAQLRVAAANRNKARRDWQRADRLSKEGALPASARDDARSALEAAEASLALGLDAFKRTKLISPVDGKIAERLAEPGESIGAGSPVLVLETTNLVVKVGVTDRDLPQIHAGQVAALQREDGGPPFPGTVSSVAPTSNPADGLYGVEIRPEDQTLQSGTLVVVRFEQIPNAPVLRVPLEAVVRRDDKDWVFLVEGEKDSGTVRSRAVEVGRAEGRQVTLRSGLKDGERIVTEGAYFLQDGQAVRILK